jgi:YD repeat-containing protein
LYNNGQPVELKEQNGITTSYIWGFNNTVPIVKSVGSSYSTLNNAYTTLGTNLRSDPSLLGAQISTYTYNNPIVGISTIKDANGRLLTYEYDKLGRLIRIKDHDGKVLEQYEYSYRIK